MAAQQEAGGVEQQALDAAAFEDQAARAKSALNPLFVLSMAAYPLVMGFTTAVRTGRMSVVSGRPPVLHSPPSPPGAPPSPPPPRGYDHDLWVTTDRHSMATTVSSFFTVLVIHLILLGHLLMKRRAGAPQMNKSYAFAKPVVMCLITISYYLNYIALSRYGVTPTEWWIFYCFSGLAILLSTVLYVAPPQEQNVVGVAG